MLARRFVVGIVHQSFSKNAVLCANEIVKMMFSLVMTSRAHSSNLSRHLSSLIRTSPRMGVPALVYLVVNLISYPALARIDASTFTAISQLKVLATALFAMFMLGTKVSGRKWRTLAMMVAGVTIISLESSPDSKHAHADIVSAHEHGDEHVSIWSELADLDYLLGVACAATQTLLSGFAAIYFEKVLKAKGSDLNVWDRNIQLAIFSIAIYFPSSFIETEGNPFAGFTGMVWFVVFLHAAGGILVALSVLYSNSITKTVAVCGSLVLTTVLGKVLFDAPLNGVILIGCVIVILSIFSYRDDSEVEEKMAKLSSGPAPHET